MKLLPLFLGSCALLSATACQNDMPRVTEGGRAQPMTQVSIVQDNPFIGLWISPSSQTVNNWVVAFTDTNLIAVDGPGMAAEGTYKLEGQTAKSLYAQRDGQAPEGAETGQTVFQLSVDGQTLTFATGDPLDPPVVLIRGPARQGELPPDSSQAFHPFTLATLSPVQ